MLRGTSFHGNKTTFRFNQNTVNILEGTVNTIQKKTFTVEVPQIHSQCSPVLYEDSPLNFVHSLA